MEINQWQPALISEEESNWPELLSDGLHFSPAGHGAMGEAAHL